ncbi:tail fiber/spike domain-containing protein [Enterobacter cloacae]|uniref:tail fiber/spike domain-containing protein n=1 Tax=Enterobacter cloacae TaxID=550 RepID=UPI002A817586|nr:right-handed parallel beta-helix repeat-containing protein [Enterobacter cloacae]
MATTPTNLPVPSESPRDLKFNAGKIDEFVTSLALQYLDRFGSAHYTIEGLRWLAQQAIAQFGWIPVESFQAGATITLPNQILKDTSTGEYYRWDGSLPKVVPAGSTPSSTGGTGVGAWISVGDSALRSMLAANDGEKLIGECPTIAILRTIEPTVDKQRITLKEHTAGTRKGGGQFRAVLNGAAYTDNNGTVIKTAGGSAWLRINADILNPLMFGAIGDGVANDAAAVNSALATGVSVNLVGLTYLTSGTPIRMDVITGRQELYGGIIKDGSVGNNNILSVGGTNKTVRNLTIDGTSGPTSRGIIVKENSADILISQCVIKECKYYAIAASYDYVNKTRCQRINVDRCWIDHCGQLGTGGGSGGASSILFDQVFTSSVTNCDLTRCNWGISWLQPFTPPAAPEPFGYYNKVINCRITGSGLTGNPYPESQGISAQSQKHLQIINNTVEQFNGNAIDNQRCEYSQIQGNIMRDCKDGVFIGDMAFIGHQIIGNNGYNCERGVRVLADASGSFTGQSMRASVIADNSFGNCVSYGIYVHHNDPTGELSNILITGNVVDNQGNRGGTTEIAGIYINGLTAGQVNNNSVRSQRRFAILVEACIGCQVHDNMVNSYDYASLTAPAIYLDSACVGVSVRNNTGFGPTTAGPMVYVNGDKNAVFGNRLRGSAQIVLNSGTNTATGDNLAF